MTQISISLPSDLVSKIDEMADAENRNRSNFIATQLTRFYESTEGRKLQQRPGSR
ncbi:MAG: CopG family ribbon-helix-helix protein [Opitutales bacterium]